MMSDEEDDLVGKKKERGDGKEDQVVKHREEKYHLVYLQAWPLTGQNTQGSTVGETIIIKRLDFEAEMEILVQSLNESRKAIKVIKDVATSDSLRLRITEGCRALHYTGHGLPNRLAFEDGYGKMHGIDADILKTLVSAGGGGKRVKFVLVSACHSEDAGEAFVKAGVPHVIAVRSQSQIQDESSRLFMKHLYAALWMGDTVQQAFDAAQSAVQAGPQAGMEEHKQFLLLPEDTEEGYHDVPIFPRIEEGKWTDLGPGPQPCSIPARNPAFQGRNVDMQKIIQNLRTSRKRLITIVGEQRIGKSTIAVATARYCHERRFFDGVFFVELPKIGLDQSLASYVATYCKIKTECNNLLALCDELRDKKYLLILDGCDKFLNEAKGSPRCIRDFIGELLHQCEKIKVLATCRTRLGGQVFSGTFLQLQERDVAETILLLEPLSPSDSAQLFWDLAPRDVSLKEFGCSDSRKAGHVLAQHAALQMLGGHPGKIFDAVQLLSHDTKLDELPAKIKDMQKKQEEEEKRKKEEEEKQLSIETSLPTPGWTPGGDEGSTPVMSHPPRSNSTGNMTPGLEENPHVFRTWSASARMSHLPQGPSMSIDEPTLVWSQNFGDKPIVSWMEFSRFLGEHFAQAARVEYRPLSPMDLQVIKEKLETQSPRDKVTHQAFLWLWRWFRSLEDSINQIRDDWCKDQPKRIYGILSRGQTEDLLRTAPVGTFILRFSENPTQNLGCLVLGYVEDNKSIRHTLIDIKGGVYEMKTSGEIFRFHSLAEVVSSCKPLRMLYPAYEKNAAFREEDDDDVPH